MLGEIEVKTKSGSTCWLLPFGVHWEDHPTTALPSRLALAQVRHQRHVGLLTDGFALAGFARRIVGALASGWEVEDGDGVLCFRNTGHDQLDVAPDAEVNWLAAEQSNSSLIVGDQIMLKMYRRIAAGEHPEAEMGRYLTAQGFAHVPPLLGDVVRVAADGTPCTLAIALGFVRNQGDAWSWTLDQLKRALDEIAAPEAAPETELADLDTVMGAIGRRLGEMHAVLARETSDPAFAPEMAASADGANWAKKAEERLRKALESIEQRETWERDQDRERAHSLLGLRTAITSAIRSLAKNSERALKTRVHGDFHLGQVLVASGDAYIIDFEGEPATSIAERRAKTSPLRDVAGLVRSIDYAGATLMDRDDVGSVPLDEDRRDEFIAGFRRRASLAFLGGYWSTSVLRDTPGTRALLDLFLIEKAAYEITYEAANRPNWIGVPLAGLSRLLSRILEKETADGHG